MLFFRSLEVCLHRKFCGVRLNLITDYMPLNLLISHKFIILLGNIASYIINSAADM